LASFLSSSLLTDPKSRKVILVEHPLLPLHIKELLARILFDNLQVRTHWCAKNIQPLTDLSLGSFGILRLKSSSRTFVIRKDNWSCPRLWTLRIHRCTRVYLVLVAFFAAYSMLSDICLSTSISPPTNNTIIRISSNSTPPCPLTSFRDLPSPNITKCSRQYPSGESHHTRSSRNITRLRGRRDKNAMLFRWRRVRVYIWGRNANDFSLRGRLLS
jgi:hypothetical protein